MKLGILGPGRIARTVAATLVQMPEIECYAVASRNRERAAEFAKDFGFEKVYDSYEAMLQDPELELVYITTPHSHHYEQMMLCLEYGKHVICEKAFTMNAGQAQKVRELAAQKGLYVAEAIWTRYMPSRKMITDLLESGAIGTPDCLTANLCYDIDNVQRIIRPELGGGALLDITVYGINFAMMCFGHDIARVESSVQMTPTGVDGRETVTLYFADGKMANLTHSIYSRSDRKGIIWGDQGYMVVENINNPYCIRIFDKNDRLVQELPVPEQISGYEYEFQEAVRLIEAGKTESESIPLQHSIEVMQVMDAARAIWGLKYPQEQ